MRKKSFFLSRLKTGCDPKIEKILSGYYKTYGGQNLSELLPLINVDSIDLEVKLNGIEKPLRVVGLRYNGKWYLYLTNIFNERFTPQIIYQIYRQRWVIELVFNDLKNVINIKKIATENENAVKIEIYSALILFLLTRIVMALAARDNKEQNKMHTEKIVIKETEDFEGTKDGYSMRKCIGIVKIYAYELFEAIILHNLKRLRHILSIIIRLINSIGFIERRGGRKALSGVT
jgi:hypothetical protein